MELVPIFVGTNPELEGGLYAVRYEPGRPDEFERLFDCWNDTEYLEAFCQEHLEDLPGGFFREISVEEAVMDIWEEAADLKEMLLELTEAGFAGDGENLQNIFKPLNNNEYVLVPLQKSKASLKTRHRPAPRLRVYAIRLAPNLYIITGGAIKLTATMSSRQHLMAELAKIARVRQWLIENGIACSDDLNYWE